jgi:integrase
MKPTYKVRFWAIKVRAPLVNGSRASRPYGVRWVTAGREHSEWFAKKRLAEKYLQKLQSAATNGEAFDVNTGLPESMYREQHSRSLLQLAQRFIDKEWPDAAPNTRRKHVDTLAVAVGAFVRESPRAPDLRKIRRVLTTYLLPPNRRTSPVDDTTAEVAEWIANHSRPVSDLTDRETAAELLRGIGKNLNGAAAAAPSIRTRRGVLFHALQHAVVLEEVGRNPLTLVKAGKSQVAVEVDPRVVVNPAQARQVLSAVTYVGRKGQYEYLYGFFASMYYAALRPAEANRLRDVDCVLPDSGWGKLVLSRSAARSNGRYTDSGVVWEERSLKRRPDGAVRVVPIPPQLVTILRTHIERFGTGPAGRLFRGQKFGEPVNPTVYTDAWKRARVIGLSPEQAASPLARRPYDLRHAAVSTWLAAGVPVAEVAERAGHTVEVLLKVYARCLDGSRATSNERIDQLFGQVT